MSIIANVTVKYSGIQLAASEIKGVIHFYDPQHSLLMCAPINKVRYDNDDGDGSIYYRNSKNEMWVLTLEDSDYKLISDYVRKRKSEIDNCVVDFKKSHN